jgi:hypothetical protein
VLIHREFVSEFGEFCSLAIEERRAKLEKLLKKTRGIVRLLNLIRQQRREAAGPGQLTRWP